MSDTLSTLRYPSSEHDPYQYLPYHANLTLDTFHERDSLSHGHERPSFNEHHTTPVDGISSTSDYLIHAQQHGLGQQSSNSASLLNTHINPLPLSSPPPFDLYNSQLPSAGPSQQWDMHPSDARAFMYEPDSDPAYSPPSLSSSDDTATISPSYEYGALPRTQEHAWDQYAIRPEGDHQRPEPLLQDAYFQPSASLPDHFGASPMSAFHLRPHQGIVVPSLSHSIGGHASRSTHPYLSSRDHIDSTPHIVPSQTDPRADRAIRRESLPSSHTFHHDHVIHHGTSQKPDPAPYAFRQDDPSAFRISADAYRTPGPPTLTQAQSQSVFRFSPGSRVVPKQPHERKPVLACLFCRKRKIACGPGHLGLDDRTCK
ncbi:hypothetical protein BOTBODRAFT_34704 [Botryobasidium botryosum FD-172 SS1]|uniref:Uncharacterized protein n=1 Tax=Botryobasidium botryosum (strain FD-172 SS1) TaxID=930990 RepID=A0A067MKI2_BOTB1|nr:hypothetical protein BOTBODRAFT_34704 [Botryobasidium botryosum FD-172 SS1]